MRLATFVHVSDLHISSDHSLDAKAPILMNLPIFDGLLGHSRRSLDLVDLFFHELKTKEDAQLIFTGDLTASGKRTEFELGTRLLASKRTLDEPGFGVQEWQKTSCPGNHDHWPGNGIMLGRQSLEFMRYFQAMPNAFLFELTAEISVRFMFIDTSAEVNWWQQVIAEGSFRQQLRTLQPTLTKRPKTEIRVLCLHHSQALRSGMCRKIDATSRQELHKFVADNDVTILLCGHVHKPLIEPFTIGSAGSTRFFECRCGTTTQRVPLRYRAYKRERIPNSLLVHRIFQDGNTVSWSTETFLEVAAGFRPAGDRYPGLAPKRFSVLSL